MSAIEFSPQMIAYADNILDYATSDDASQEALEEMRNAAPIKAGNWHQACIEEGNPWNFFHNSVQNHIRNTKSEEFDKFELQIIFKEEVENPVTKKKSTVGNKVLYNKPKFSVGKWFGKTSKKFPMTERMRNKKGFDNNGQICGMQRRTPNARQYFG